MKTRPEATPERAEYKSIFGPQYDVADGLGNRAVRGVFWSYTAFVGAKLLSFVAIVILARLLMPVDFGQVGMALIVIGYLDVLGNFGVNAALIYERSRPRQAANVVFAISLVTAVVWFLVAQSIAPAAAAFFREPSVEPMLRTLAWVFPITALGSAHDALLQKELAFRKRLLPELLRAGFKGIASISFALTGFGAWSLVWGQLLGALVATITLWIVVPWRPGLAASKKLAGRLLRYGMKIFLSNVVGTVTSHLDTLIVARFLGSVSLGLYMIAYRAPELVLSMVIWAVGKVTFPTYVKLQNDHDLLRRAYLRTLRFVSLFTVPAGCGLALTSPYIVLLIFGSNWLPSIPVMQALALSLSLRSLGTSSGDVLKAVGRVDLLIKMGIARGVVLIPGLIFGAQYDITGVAMVVMVVNGLFTIVRLAVVSRLLSIPPARIARQFVPAVINSFVMTACLATLVLILDGHSNLTILLILVPVGSMAYVISTKLFTPRTFNEAYSVATTALVKST